MIGSSAAPVLSAADAAVAGSLSTPSPANATSGSDAARARVLASLARDLAAHFNADGDLVLELQRPLALAEAEWAVSLTEFPSTLAGSLLLRVRLTAPGQTTREESLTVRAQLFRDAWFVQTPVDRGAAFDPVQCELRRIDALRERDALPASIGRSSEWVFLRPVPVGRLVNWRDLARRALVRKGDVIEVAAVDGPLHVSMKALAMQDGGQGETVRVRNLESKREFSALVVAENRAQVRF